MSVFLVRFLSLLSVLFVVNSTDVFHVNSKVTFYPNEMADYFGYSVLLSDMGLHVGAPKAKSRTTIGSAPGDVFTCPLSYPGSRVPCHPVGRRVLSNLTDDFFRDDMWFGAQMAATPDSKLLVCAPRNAIPYQEDKHILPIGACYVLGYKEEHALIPLNDKERFAYRTDGKRKEYGAYGTHLNYFAYGQAGLSMAYTKDHHLIIGAPGVLQWTGAVINYSHKQSYTFEKNPTANPYYTKDLGPDDYFGYSVDSGVFQVSGPVLYVAGAPRAKKSYGQVFIFEASAIESTPLNIKAKLRGPQLGGYFGAALCVLDLNRDGISDLLVGAPNYSTRLNGELTYDQGAVFVYITKTRGSNFRLEDAGSVRGSEASGARFGTAIADLGDIDGDGNTDVAIGAPWENDGAGVVYIYRGSERGLSPNYYQRIYAEGAKSFGISIAKGYDVDRNKCNDLAIGAHNSRTAYIYRSIPTIQVISSIKVPDAKNLKQDADNFTAHFCVTVPPNKLWSNVEIRLKAIVTVDPDGGRANTLGETEYNVIAKPGVDSCDEQIIKVLNQSDLSKPILFNFELIPAVDLDSMVTFPRKEARLSDTSVLKSSFLIQLLSDCGEDLVCTPWLEMNLEPLENETSYVPGIDSKLGAKITVTNLAEPAYSVRLHVVLPCPPKRLDSSCSLHNLDLYCDLPAPLKRNKKVAWDIELEYAWDGAATELKMTANLEDPVYMRRVSAGAKELAIKITPNSVYNATGIAESNATIVVSRETFTKNGDVLFTHYFEITNFGPSDLYNLKINFLLSEGVSLASEIEGVINENSSLAIAPFLLRTNATTAYHLPLRFNLTEYSKLLEEDEVLNVSSTMLILIENGFATGNKTIEVKTTLILEPKTPIWPIIVAVVAGLLVLAAIILALYKFGFFSRQKKDDLKKLLEDRADPGSSSSSNQLADADGQNPGLLESDQEL